MSDPQQGTGAGPPAGPITFLFTALEANATLWEQHPQAMPAILDQHDALVHEAVAAEAGWVFKTGDGYISAAFSDALAALNAALRAQAAIQAADWDTPVGPIKVCMALHSGEAEHRAGDYFGPPLNRVARLRAAGHGGQVLLSDVVRAQIADRLPPGITLRDLGERRLRDLAAPIHIYEALAPGLPAEFPPLKTLDTRPTNLPAQPTALIGRDAEVAAASALLRRMDVRLLTLTGPGGTGKTRLSLQIGADLLDEFADGVFFIALAPIADPGLVASTIASTLGIKEVAGHPLIDTLNNVLYDKQLLLLLDNFEQVTAAAPMVATLLESNPQIKIVVTTRILLHLVGEQEFAVPPLALPDLAHLPAPLELLGYPAVALFVARAQAARFDFQLTLTNAPSVAEICVRLDGLPLAIELAAARIRRMEPQEMVAQLTSRLALGTGGFRDRTARQQSLRGAISWSYDLLDPVEQSLFAHLGVFVGGCTVATAEQVLDTPDLLPHLVSLTDTNLLRRAEPILDHPDLLPRLMSLAEKSLLRKSESSQGEPRFWMLETIREYALEQLAAGGEADTLRTRHAHYYLALAEEAEPELSRADQGRWVARLASELDNLRAVLDWARDGGDVEVGLRLAGALERFWNLRNYYTEGRERLNTLLALSEGAGATLGRGKGLRTAGHLAWRQGDYSEARTHYETSLRIFRLLDDQPGIARVLNNLGVLASDQGDYTTAQTWFRQSLALRREMGDQEGMALALNNLGMIAREAGEYAQARAFAEEALTIARELGDKRLTAVYLLNLGLIALFQGDYERAAPPFTEALARAEELEAPHLIATTQVALGWLAGCQSNYAQAHTWLEEAVRALREIGAKGDIAFALITWGLVTGWQGAYDSALALLEEGRLLCREIGNTGDGITIVINLGMIALRQGDRERAAVLCQEALTLLGTHGDKWRIAAALLGLGGVAAQAGEAARAVRLLGASDAILAAIGGRLWPADRADQERYLGEVRAVLAPARFAAAWAAGQALTLDQALAYALQDVLPGSAPAPPEPLAANG